MKYFPAFILLFLFAFQSNTTQESEHYSVIINDIRNSLSDDLYCFHFMEANVLTNTTREQLTYVVDDEIKFISPLAREKFEHTPSDNVINLVSKESITYTLKNNKSNNTFELLSTPGSGVPNIFIDFESKKVQINGRELSFDKAINVTSEDNYLNSQWIGLQWASESYNFVIGKLKKDGKIYLQIKKYADKSEAGDLEYNHRFLMC